MKVAFIDDNATHRVWLGAFFKEADVYSGPCEKLRGYDIVFMDYDLGDLNGLEEARKLKNKNQKIIMLTGYDHIDCEFQVLLKGDVSAISQIIESVS